MKVEFTDPTNAVLTVARVKDFLRITDADSDTLLGELLTAATRDVMGYTKRSIASRTVTAYFDIPEIQDGKVHLLYGPVTAITSVTNYDAEGSATVIDSDNYYLTNDDWLVAQNAGFLSSVGRSEQAVKVIFVAGYAVDPASPTASEDSYAVSQLQHAVRLRIADLYTQRTSEEVGTIVAESKGTTWKKVAKPFKQLPLI